MKFSVTTAGQVVGTIDVTEDVYADDDALLDVLADAGYIEGSEVLEVTEDKENQVDVLEYETGSLRLSLILIH